MKANDPTSSGSKSPSSGLAGKMYLPLFVQGLTTTTKHLFRPKVTVSFPEVRPEDRQPADLSRRASAEQGRRGPRQVRGLFPVRHGLPGPLHRHRGRRKPLARPREISGKLHDRRAALHLLRHVRRGLPGRRDRADQPVRPDRPQPRRDDFRQGKAAERLRPDERRRADEVATRWGARCERAMPSYRGASAARCCWRVGMWLMLPRGARRAAAGWAAAGRVSLGLLASQMPRGERLGDDIVFFIAGRRHGLVGRRARSRFATRSTRPSGSPCRCWARRDCSCFRGAVSGRGHDRGLCRGDPGHVSVRADAGPARGRGVLRSVELGARAWRPSPARAGGRRADAGIVSVFQNPDWPVGRRPPCRVDGLENEILADQHVAHLGASCSATYLVAVEVAGTLLLVALVGTVAIAERIKRPTRRPIPWMSWPCWRII